MFPNKPPDLSAMAEQLCRIEHKLDLMVEFLAMSDGKFPLRLMNDKENRDPLTQELVTYFMDIFKGHAIRKSLDGTGLLPPFRFDSLPPTSGNTGNKNGGNDEGGDPGY